MDPYLEAADTWPDFHDALANEIRVELNKVLPAPYYARLQKRTELGLVLESGTLHRIVPDLTVLRRTLHEPSPAWEIGTTTAVSMRPRTEATAGIDEIVSPSNKAPGPDRRSYEVKQAEVLSSDANLIEIDLLRSGRRLLPFPEMGAVVDDLNCDYLVVLNRSVLRQGDWMDYTLYPVNLQEPLPCILVPLAGQDPDVLLDLQVVADRVYEGGAYHRVADYLAEPEPPLSSEDLAWADQLLRAAGLR